VAKRLQAFQKGELVVLKPYNGDQRKGFIMRRTIDVYPLVIFMGPRGSGVEEDGNKNLHNKNLPEL
jgi:hypothetical protein